MRRLPVWTLAISALAIFMVSLDNLVVSNALTSHPRGSRRIAGGARVDRQRVHARVRRVPPHRRRARRPLRPAQGLRRRPRHLHRRVSRRRARAEHRRADRRAGGAGARRRHRRAAQPHAAERRDRARAARPRARPVVGHQRPRRRARPARRRRGDRGDLVAVDLLAQRPGRPGARPARRCASSRRATARPGGSTSRASRSRRPACSASSSASSAATRRAGAAPRSSLPIAIGAALLVAFVAWELRAAAPMLPMRFFRSRAFAATNGVSLAMTFGIFGSIFLLAQFFQTVQGYSPLEAGLRTLPWTGMPMLVAPIAGVLSDRVGSPPADGRPACSCRRSR